MIQFNLLPDVKQEFIKARRTQHLVLAVAVLAAGFALFVLIVLFMVVNVLQKTHLSAVNNDIKKYSDQLNSNQDLPKILTIQNQLKSLQEPPNNLLLQRPLASRLNKYIPKLVPNKVSIGQLDIDFDAHTMVITGAARTINDINKFVDTLKFTKYSTIDATSEQKAFNNVVLGTFGRTGKESTYTINLSYDPLIFDGTKDVSLDIPKITTTRSKLDEPLFKDIQKSTPTNEAQ